MKKLPLARKQPIEDGDLMVIEEGLTFGDKLKEWCSRSIPFLIALCTFYAMARGVSWYENKNPSAQCAAIIDLFEQRDAQSHMYWATMSLNGYASLHEFVLTTDRARKSKKPLK